MPQTAEPPAAPADPRRKKIILLAAAAVVLLGVWMTLVHFRVWPFHHIGGRLEIAALTTEQVAGKAKVGKPTAAERQLYTEYAQRVKRYASVRMSRSERASGSALAALVHMQAKGETIQGRDGFTARAKELAEGEAKVESSFFGRVRSWFLPLVVVFADDSGGADEAQYSAGLMNNVANVQMLQGQFYNPLLFAALASIADPDNPNVCVTLANLLKDAGDYDNAIATVQYGLKLNPKSETLLYTGGMISLERKELQDAENYFMTAMNISGGPGPSNQGMMLVSMARKDYGSAFLFMLEGGRDSFTMPVWRVYQKLRLKPNYFKMSGAIFDQLGLANLMDLSRTRTGRKPKFDALTQGIEIDHRFNFPSSAADLNRSGDQMALDTIKYIQGTAKYYEEDANQLKEAFDILSAGSLKDMYGRFKASSLAPKAKTKAEMQVNWYREEFWLCILNDYFAWEKKKIADQFKKDSEAADGFFDKFGLHLEDVYDKYIEKMDAAQARMDAAGPPTPGNIAWLQAYASYLQTAMPHLEAAQNDATFTLPEDQKPLTRDVNTAVSALSDAINKEYADSIKLVDQYWIYASGLLAIVGDEAIYKKYRSEVRNNVLFTLSGPVVYAGGIAGILVGTQMGPMGLTMMIGKEGGLDGAQTGFIPIPPLLPVLGMGEPPKQIADMWSAMVPPSPDRAVSGTVTTVDMTSAEMADYYKVYLQQHSQDCGTPKACAQLFSEAKLEKTNQERMRNGQPPLTELPPVHLCMKPRPGSTLFEWDCVEQRDASGDGGETGLGVGDFVLTFKDGEVSQIGTPNVSTRSSGNNRHLFISGPSENMTVTVGSNVYGASAGVGVGMVLDESGTVVEGYTKAEAYAGLGQSLNVKGEASLNVAGSARAKIETSILNETYSSSWSNAFGLMDKAPEGLRYIWKSISHPFGGE